MDFLISFLNVLLRDGVAYVNNLELLVLCVFYVLYKLVFYCEVVRDILFVFDDVFLDFSVFSFEKVIML